MIMIVIIDFFFILNNLKYYNIYFSIKELINEQAYNNKSDIWSLGIFFFFK